MTTDTPPDWARVEAVKRLNAEFDIVNPGDGPGWALLGDWNLSEVRVLARLIAKQTRERGLKSVAGGGDTVAALTHAGMAGELSYLSNAGGAFLEWLEGKNDAPLSAAVALCVRHAVREGVQNADANQAKANDGADGEQEPADCDGVAHSDASFISVDFSVIDGRQRISDGRLLDLELHALIERHNALSRQLIG